MKVEYHHIILLCLIMIHGLCFGLNTEDIPDEFRNLSDSFESSVGVYYLGNFIGDYEIDYDGKTLKFLNPNRVLAQFKTLKDKKIILNALGKPLPTNQNLVCIENIRIPVCEKPKTKTISIVFNPDWFRVDMFIDYKYIDSAKEKKHLVGMPKTQLSFLNGINFIMSGNEQNPQLNIYTLTNTGAISLGSANLNYQLVSRALRYGSENQEINNQFQTLDASLYYDRYRFSLGYLQSQGNYFLVNQHFFGLSATTDKNLLDTKYLSKYGSNLQIFLNEPSQVTVINNGRVISANNYAQGLQNIDTSSLPEGSYNLTLRVTDFLGKSTEMNQFFIKSTALPPPKFPDYFINTGYITDIASFEGLTPPVSREVLVNFGVTQRILDHWGLKTSFLQLSDYSYIEAGIFGKYQDFYIEPSMLIGLDKDFGLAIGFTYQHNQYVNSVLSARSIWAKYEESLEELNSDQFIVNQKSLNISTNLHYNKHILDLSAQINEFVASGYQTSLTASYQYQLYHDTSTNISIGSAVNKTGDAYAINATLNVTFNTDNWSLSAQNSSQYKSEAPNTYNSQLSGVRTFNQDIAERQQIGVVATLNNTRNSIGGNFYYQNQYVLSNGSINYTPEIDTLFDLLFSTTIGVSTDPINFDFAYIPQSQPTHSAVLINISGDNDDEGEFEVYEHRSKIGTLSSINSSKLIPLSPFRKYDISIRSISKQAYQFDQKSHEATYFPGNIYGYNWYMSRLITASATLLLPSGKLGANLVFIYNDSIYESDEEGYVVFEYLSSQKKITFAKDSLPYCQITPLISTNLDNQAIIIELGNTLCEPVE